jgi:hypothetical protein
MYVQVSEKETSKSYVQMKMFPSFAPFALPFRLCDQSLYKFIKASEQE